MPCNAVLRLALGVLALAPAAALADETLAERRTRLDQMPAAQKQELLLNKEHFDRLSPAEQQRLRMLQRELAADAEAERMRGIMLRYSQWLQSLPSGQRAELLSLDPAQRLEEIKRLVDRQERQRFNDLAVSRLQPSDRDAILEWMNGLLKVHETDLLRSLPDEMRERMLNAPTGERRRILFFALRQRMEPDLSIIDFLQPTEADIEELAEKLSAEARGTLEAVNNSAERQRLLRNWAGAAFFSRFAPPQVTREQLIEFYEGLDPTTKEFLENLPRDRMLSELRRLHTKQWHDEHGPFRGSGGRRRPGPGPGPPPPGRPPGASRPELP